MAFEAEADVQFVGDELEVRRSLQSDKLLEKAADRFRPIRMMIATGCLGTEPGAFGQPQSTESVEVSTAHIELFGGIRRINASVVKLL